MDDRISVALTAVRRRQQLLFALKCAGYGLLTSAVLGVLAGINRLLFDASLTLGGIALLFAAGPVLGVLVGFIIRRSWSAAATAVDTHYELKDRTISALEFSSAASGDVLRELQIDDAAEHLTQLQPAEVIPFRWPKALGLATATTIVAAGLLFWPRAASTVNADPAEPLPGVLAAADIIQDEIDELEDFAKDVEDEELQRLVDELREDVEAMQKPDVDVKEALVAISEMQEQLQALQAEYNEALVDSHLQSLGSAMMAATSLQAVGQPLEVGDFEKAELKLDELQKAELTHREKKAVSENMRKVATAMQDSGLGQLSEAVSETTEGLGSGDAGKTSKGGKKIKRLLKRHRLRKKLNKMLLSKCKALGECKGMCKGGNPNTGLAKKSTKPSLSWGLGTHGELDGQGTEITSNRNLEEITGTAGEGPSDVEVTTSPEGREQAGRSYREVFQEYQKLSEEVLDAEPIPLGHRQTIRRYFELIRPQQAEEPSL